MRIVAIDEASLRRLGHWPWPRSTRARPVERIDAAGDQGTDRVRRAGGRGQKNGEHTVPVQTVAPPSFALGWTPKQVGDVMLSIQNRITGPWYPLPPGRITLEIPRAY